MTKRKIRIFFLSSVVENILRQFPWAYRANADTGGSVKDYLPSRGPLQCRASVNFNTAEYDFGQHKNDSML